MGKFAISSTAVPSVDILPVTMAGRPVTRYHEALPKFAVPSPERSRNMSAIKSKNTSPERKTRQALHRDGFRFRLHATAIPGSPDVVLTQYRTVVFVHGCFWHGHECRIGHIPRSNSEYWKAKIDRNVTRDARNFEILRQNGWRVRVVRECSFGTDVGELIEELRKIRHDTRLRPRTA